MIMNCILRTSKPKDRTGIPVIIKIGASANAKLAPQAAIYVPQCTYPDKQLVISRYPCRKATRHREPSLFDDTNPAPIA